MLADELRRIVLGAVPDAIERVRPGWRLIGYDLLVRRHGAFFALGLARAGACALRFPAGVDMVDPRTGELEGAGIPKLARWLTYAPGTGIDERQGHAPRPGGGEGRLIPVGPLASQESGAQAAFLALVQAAAQRGSSSASEPEKPSWSGPTWWR